ncbi:MAG: 5-methyltetrahydropteroyltriglutamate--homocysteine methyltransferase, partial [Muribaculaceae bacterium]|nr:5-methyltetrahydropteroyltriglutamate--homocysteine methyltransferase [Muribaculaceae bacterium]
MKVEIVGSFFLPDRLYNARDDFKKGIIDAETLKEAEDEAVKVLVERQLSIGLSQVTSGEFRRDYWDKDFWFGLDGISKVRFDSGRVYQDAESC